MGLVPGARDRGKKTMLEEMRQEGSKREGKGRKCILLTSKQRPWDAYVTLFCFLQVSVKPHVWLSTILHHKGWKHAIAVCHFGRSQQEEVYTVDLEVPNQLWYHGDNNMLPHDRTSGFVFLLICFFKNPKTLQTKWFFKTLLRFYSQI